MEDRHTLACDWYIFAMVIENRVRAFLEDGDESRVYTSSLLLFNYEMPKCRHLREI